MPVNEKDRQLTELKTKLNNALTEASQKLEPAIKDTRERGTNYVKTIWYSAEAIEYASALYSLTYDFEDYDPLIQKPARRKSAVQLLLVAKEAMDEVFQLTNNGLLKEGYASLRKAAEYSKRAYLGETTVRAPVKRRRLTK